jgi:Domain of unknown function (DUF4157)
MGKLQIPHSKTSGSTIFQPSSRPFAPPRSVPKVQAKLTLGPVGDRYEKEADQVASQVVQHISSPAAAEPGAAAAAPGVAQRAGKDDELDLKPLPGAVQRDGPEDELMKKPLPGAVQRDDLEDEIKKKPLPGAVQRSSGAEGGPIGGDVERSIEGARSGGRSLDKEVRASMEPAFGADFSGVKVHADAKADGLNRSLQARAFTTGQDVFFRGGEYNPGSSGGKELLAHELTHVVQQNGGAVMKKPEPGVSALDSYLDSREGDRNVPVVGNRFGSPAGRGGASSEE